MLWQFPQLNTRCSSCHWSGGFVNGDLHRAKGAAPRRFCTFPNPGGLCLGLGPQRSLETASRRAKGWLLKLC